MFEWYTWPYSLSEAYWVLVLAVFPVIIKNKKWVWIKFQALWFLKSKFSTFELSSVRVRLPARLWTPPARPSRNLLCPTSDSGPFSSGRDLGANRVLGFRFSGSILLKTTTLVVWEQQRRGIQLIPTSQVLDIGPDFAKWFRVVWGKDYHEL